MIIVAGGIGTQDRSENSSGLFSLHFGEKLLIGGSGLAIGLSGVPFMISGAANARKAASVDISNQTILLPRGNVFVARSLPSISLKIDLP